MEMCHFCLRQCHCSGESKAHVLGQGSCIHRAPTGIRAFFKEWITAGETVTVHSAPYFTHSYGSCQGLKASSIKRHTPAGQRSPRPCTSCPISAPSPGRNCDSGKLVAKVRDSGDLVAKVASESCESGQEVWRSLNWVPGTAQGLAKPF